MHGESFTYCVKIDGTFTSIEGPWDQFAAQNHGIRLLRSGLIGKNLFDYIKNREIQDIYRSFHSILEKKPERVFFFPYRCDSPCYRRDMNMELSIERDTVKYVSTIIKLHKHDLDYFIDYKAQSGEIVNMCSFCKNFEMPDGIDTWHPLEEIFSRAPQSYRISHEICPNCENLVYASLRE